jgi:FecCD transport family
MPMSLLLGAAFVVVADTLARTLAPIELPLSVLTASVGAPFFLWLLGRGRRSEWFEADPRRAQAGGRGTRWACIGWRTDGLLHFGE